MSEPIDYTIKTTEVTLMKRGTDIGDLDQETTVFKIIPEETGSYLSVTQNGPGESQTILLNPEEIPKFITALSHMKDCIDHLES